MPTIRTAFLNIPIGPMHSIADILAQLVRSSTRLTIAPAITKAMVERIPLHCGATSISMPGSDITMPFLNTGTPANRKRM
jgi:hypothetical protein